MTLVERLRRAKILSHVLLTAGAVIMLYPLLWMLFSSFKPESAIFGSTGLWPSTFTLENYTRGWRALQVPFSRFFVNSFLVAGFAVLGNVFMCSLTAYAFARLNFKLRKFWFALMLGTTMLPGQVTLIPQYIMFHKLGWVNTFLPLVIPHFLATDAFFIFLNVQFIRGLPRDLDDAASVDGANRFQIYRSIIFPLSTPALVTTAIFTFIWTWNNFLSQLVYLNKTQLFTVPLALRQFVSSMDQSSYGQMFAMSCLSLIPVFVFFIVAQRNLVEGISTTGFKG